ncbi:hypothetical protein ABPG75_006430 [Micractinium tetrahymenae]
MATQHSKPSPLPPSDDSQTRLLAETASGLGGEEEGPDTVSAETQTALLADAAVQYEPPAAGADSAQLAAQLASDELADFLEEAVPRCEAALQQNELLDALADELAALAEEEGEAGVGPGAGAGGRSAAAGLTETHTFSDLMHSKGRTLAAVAWHPGRRGVVAAACTQQPGEGEAAALSSGAATSAAATAGARGAVAVQQTPLPSGRQEQRSQGPGAATAQGAAGSAAAQLRQPPPGCILIWSHSDAIHPELVLQPPAQALAFAFHPTPPHAWLAAGLSTGQVALFNLQQQAPAAGQAPGGAGAVMLTAAGTGSAAAASAAAEEGRDEGSRATVLLPAFVSSPDACHQAPITDLQWLPGLLVWDMRISTRPRKAKEEEAPAWKPALALGAGKPPLMATRFSPDPRAAPGRFLLGSLEGEVAVAQAALSLQEQKGSNAIEWMLGTLQLSAGHTGRVLALAFSPFFSDTLLVVGDNGFVVWRAAAGNSSSGAGSSAGSGGGSTGAAAPGGGGGASAEAHLVAVFESPFCADALYTCGCWSPSKPGVVVMGRADGRLEAWDLLDRSHQPAMVAPVAPCALTALAASPAAASGAPGGSRSAAGHHQLLAVGDAAGTLRLLELPRALRRRGHAEVRAMAALLAREQERLGEVARRAEARAAQARAAAEKARAEAAAAATGAVRRVQQEATAAGARAGAQGTDGEEESPEAAAERHYLALETEWRQQLLGGAGGATDTASVPLAAA